MKNIFRRVLLFTMLTVLVGPFSLKVNAEIINVDFPELHVSYEYEVPDYVVQECLTPRLVKDCGYLVPVEDIVGYDGNSYDADFVLKNDRPLLTNWLNGLANNPNEFFKAYFAAKMISESGFWELKRCIECINNGKIVRFDFCSREDRIEMFSSKWKEIDDKVARMSEGDSDASIVETDEIYFDIWSGWHSAFDVATGTSHEGKYKHCLKVPNFPIREILKFD